MLIECHRFSADGDLQSQYAMLMDVQQVLQRLDNLADPLKIETKARKFGIKASNSLGIYHSDLKALAKEIGQDNQLALELYDTGIYEARILCSKIYEPGCLSVQQMEQWAADFENWEICDSFCMRFFAGSDHALALANKWSNAKSEFVKRAGFVIMASYGFVHKRCDNEVFERFFPLIETQAYDDRQYVRKAVNWALRNIGKRNIDLQRGALAVSRRLCDRESKSAKWIGSNALAELTKPGVNILDYPRSHYRSAGNRASR